MVVDPSINRMTATAHDYSAPTVLDPPRSRCAYTKRPKRLGVWNPSQIDFSQDRADWEAMGDDRRAAILRLTARFLGGQQAVTVDLLPLVLAIAGATA